MTEYYTPEEIAARLKLHINTVWRYLKSGRLKASRIGNRYRVSDEQLELFLSETSALGVPMTVREESAGALKYDTSHQKTSDKPRVSAYGKHPLKGRTLDDIMREKHEETEREEHRREDRRK